ncbi:MAG: hypothetical protein IPJ42_17950 [Betaproteobacteria bacterium]|nr:hypothetical protein [Betaproteobacteria bacterium]
MNQATKGSDPPAPLPVVGLRAACVVAPNWYLEASGQFSSASRSKNTMAAGPIFG